MADFLRAKELVKAAEDLVHLKVDMTQSESGTSIRKEMRKAIARQVHKMQFEESEKEVTNIVADVLTKQIEDMAHGLMDLEEKGYKTKSHADTANVLVSQVSDPKSVKEELVNRLLPIMAIKMVEAAVSQMIQVGVDPRKSGSA